MTWVKIGGSCCCKALDRSKRRMLNFCTMRWALISSILVVFIIIPSLLGAHDLSPFGNILGPGPQSPFDKNQHDSRMPECPNCVSWEDSTDPFLHEDTEIYLLRAVSPSSPIAPVVLLDQGFVRSIFRPPTSIL